MKTTKEGNTLITDDFQKAEKCSIFVINLQSVNLLKVSKCYKRIIFIIKTFNFIYSAYFVIP